MKRIFVVVCSALFLQGCFMRLERVAELTPIKSERDYWSKANMSDELRQSDWLDCGGDKRGMWVTDLPNETPSKLLFEASDKKINEIMACMRTKGYVRGRGGEGWLPR